MTDKKNRKPFNLLLSPDEYTMLQQLAAQSGMSAGVELRAALRARHAMIILQCPTCANGTGCYVPHVHSRVAPPAGAQSFPPIPTNHTQPQ